MADHPFLILDVFTDVPLAGNQLAVFTDGRAIAESLLQPLAREMGFSETVFLLPPDDAAIDARLRIFTPGRELPFAGHPVLGTAVAVAMARDAERVVLGTGAGPVEVTVERTGARSAFGRMEQPIPTVSPYPEAPALLAVLGIERSELPVDIYDNGVQHVFVTVSGPDALATLTPDLAGLTQLVGGAGRPFVGVNVIAGGGDRWTSRMFAPAAGVDEDAATGSAAGPLAVHVARHGRIPFGHQITISQGAAIGRPSTLLAVAHGTADAVTGVEVAGGALIVADGNFTLPDG